MPMNSLSLSVLLCRVFIFCLCPALLSRMQGNDLETEMFTMYTVYLMLVTAACCLNVCSYVKQGSLCYRSSMSYHITQQSSFELQDIT